MTDTVNSELHNLLRYKTYLHGAVSHQTFVYLTYIMDARYKSAFMQFDSMGLDNYKFSLGNSLTIYGKLSEFQEMIAYLREAVNNELPEEDQEDL